MAMILFQGYLTEEQARYVEQEAEETGESKAAIIRKIIDRDIEETKKDSICGACGAGLD